MQSLCYSPAINPSHPLMQRGPTVLRLKTLPWYKSGPRWVDVSGFRNHGALTNGPVWHERPASFSSLKMDGSTTFVDVNGNLGITTGVTYSIFAWIKPAATGLYQIILEGQNPAGTGLNNYSLMLNTTPKVTSYTSGGSIDGSGGTVTTDVWSHVGVTFDGTNIATYLNGVQQATAAGGVTSGATLTRIGARASGNTCFSGPMDDVLVILRCLSTGEVHQLYESTTRFYDPTLNWIDDDDLFAPTAAVAGPVPWDIPHSPQHQAVMAM